MIPSPPAELDPRIFGNWRIRSESCSGEENWYRHTVVGPAGDLFATPERDSQDSRRRDDGARIDLIFQAPELYAQLRAAVMALRSYQLGNASPDLAESIADQAQALLDRVHR